MNKQELIASVASTSGESKACVGRVINSMLSTMSMSLSSGNSVVLHGFGIFSKVTRAARLGRNPSTGQSMQIAAKDKVTFKGYKGLLE